MAYNPVIQNSSMDDLYEAIMSLSSLEDYYKFFEDLCTVNEIQAMAQRFEVAKLLTEGITYHEIVQRTGASTATISRVNRCLQYGPGGYAIGMKQKDQGDINDSE